MLTQSTGTTNEPEIMAEARLWQAVIASTIEEWVSGPLRRQREAEEFLFNDQRDFPALCERAGMDVSRLRSRLARLRKTLDASQPALRAA